MRGLFTLTYVLLWGLVVLEAVLLREILRRTVWFKRLHADFSRKLGARGWIVRSADGAIRRRTDSPPGRA